MSTDSYIEAKDALERHEAKIQTLGSLMVRAGTALLQQPGRMIFSNVHVGLPMEASMSKDSVSINATDLRTPEQIQQMLADWHKLRDAMMGEWAGMSPAAQGNVTPPDRRRRA